jgi:hypothetical protein
MLDAMPAISRPASGCPESATVPEPGQCLVVL